MVKWGHPSSAIGSSAMGEAQRGLWRGWGRGGSVCAARSPHIGSLYLH